MTTKFEVERFNGKGDFSLWKKKMYALLVQQKVSKALAESDAKPDKMTDEDFAEMKEIAFSTIIMYLADNVLRQVNDQTTAKEVWAKLDEIYLTKSLTNKLYLKEKFFGFKMDTSKDLEQNLDEFNRITIDLSNIEVKLMMKTRLLYCLTLCLKHIMKLRMLSNMVEIV